MRTPFPIDFGRRQGLLGAAAVALLGALHGCSRRSAAPAAEALALKVALPQVPHTGLLHLAAARNFFDAQGLAVTLLPQIHGKAALTALLQGQADLAVAADVPVVVEVLKGAPLGIAATVANASNELAVLGRRDRGISKPVDLQGRRVGVSLGTSGEYFLWAFLVRHRIAPQSTELVDLPPGRLIESLRTGQVDAIAAWQPVRHETELAFGDAIVSLHAPDAYSQSFVLVGRNEFLASHQPTLRKFIEALLAAEQFALTQPVQAKTLLAEIFQLSPATLDPAWQDVALEVEQQQAQLVTLEDVATWAMARGYAPVQPMPNFLANLSLDALTAVSPERVTVVR